MNSTSQAITDVSGPGGRIPALGLGTWQLEGDECREVVRTALELGYRHVDTAHMYENEREVGRGLQDAGVDRSEIFLTTKLQREELDPDGVRQSCSRSLDRLNTPYLDLLLIHWPEDETPVEDTIRTLAELRTEGLTRHIGVSNFPVAWMERALGATDVPIFCNQVEYHVMLDQSPVLEYCRGHEMPLVAYSPLAQGAAREDDTLAAIGKKHRRSASQVALRWLVQQSGVVAIPKSSSEEHLRQNMQVFDFELDDEDLGRIDALPKNRRRIDPPWSPDWDTPAD